nr:hypothetical protein [Spirochaetales bacterium]
MITSGLGQHYFHPVTQYMSTISSIVYKVSEGYSHDESIKGIVTGTTASEFLGNIIKKDEG